MKTSAISHLIPICAQRAPALAVGSSRNSEGWVYVTGCAHWRGLAFRKECTDCVGVFPHGETEMEELRFCLLAVGEQAVTVCQYSDFAYHPS